MCIDDLFPQTTEYKKSHDQERWPARVAMLSIHTSPLAVPGSRDVGGMNVYVLRLAKELASRDIKVDVFTRWNNPDDPLIQEVTDGFRVINVRSGPPRSISRESLYKIKDDIAQSINTFAESEGIEYDVLHTHYWISGVVGLCLVTKWSVPWLHMSHTLGLIKNKYRGPNQPEESLLRLRAEDMVLKSVDGVIAANSIERSEIVNHYQVPVEKVYIAPCGVDLALFSPGDKTEARQKLGIDVNAPLVLYVGRIEPLKGLDVLIRAFAVLKADISNAKLMIVGGTNDKSDKETAAEIRRLRALAYSLGVLDDVNFCGPKPQEELPYYYRSADICVVSSYYESFGMAALEAIACGIPIVASRVGGLQSTVRDGHNGFLVPAGDHAKLAAAMHKILSAPELRNTMAMHAHKRAHRFSWVRVGDHNLAIYHDVYARKNASNYGLDAAELQI